MRAPFTLQGTQPGIVAEFHLALTRTDEPPPPPPVHTAHTPHPHVHRPELIHHPSSQEEGSGSTAVSFAPGGDLQLDPAGCELDAEMAVQLEAGEMEEQGQAAQAQAQAHTEEGGRGGSADTLWRTFTLSQPGEPLDHLEALVRGARCAVVTCSPVAASDTSPRCVRARPRPPPPTCVVRPPRPFRIQRPCAPWVRAPLVLGVDRLDENECAAVRALASCEGGADAARTSARECQTAAGAAADAPSGEGRRGRLTHPPHPSP